MSDQAQSLLSEFPEHTYEQWHAAAEALLKGAPFEKLLVSKTYEDITIQPIYRREDIANLEHRKHFPGSASLVRGSHAHGFLGAGWEVSQELRACKPEKLNSLIHEGLDGGQSELNITNCAAVGNLADITTALNGVAVDAISTRWHSGADSLAIAALFSIGATTTASAQAKTKTVMVGGAPMYPTKNIVENAVNSKDHTTLVTALKAAGLVETLQSAGPFTVFAPTNEAFGKLPAGTVETLVKPENKEKLTKILTYHVVAGRMTAADLTKAIKAGKGSATLKTVSGGTLTAMAKGKTIMLKDEKGGVSTVTIADVLQSNGVIHVVNTVLMPK